MIRVAEISLLTFCLVLAGCSTPLTDKSVERIPVILDTDANNEIDDQHAIAYTLLNGDFFDVKGLTINRTRSGGGIDDQYAEAVRVVSLCRLEGVVPVIHGASGNFDEISEHTASNSYDGSEAVDFIINHAHDQQGKLVVIAVGKLTNLALALKKDPSIANKIRLVWLGSNYPEPGEYNLVNDIPSMNYVLQTDVPFEIVPTHYGKPHGTDAVRMSQEEALRIMPGLGPQSSLPVYGRHGGSYTNFGDYSASLFENVECHGDPPSRALFDMAAVAIVKNPGWATLSTIEAPVMVDKKWEQVSGSDRTVLLWENFDKEAIIEDFLGTLRNPVLAK